MHRRTRQAIRALKRQGAKRIAVIGGPNAGKTTMGRELSSSLGLPFFEADDTMGMGWSEGSRFVADAWMPQDAWVIVGASVVRALRKRMRATRSAPCDAVIVLKGAKAKTNRYQDAMREGIWTMMYGEKGLRSRGKYGIDPMLRRRGVRRIVAA